MNLRAVTDQAPVFTAEDHGVLTPPDINNMRLEYIISEMQKIEKEGGADLSRYRALVIEKNRVSASYCNRAAVSDNVN
jgi:hypothetical protein